MRLLGYFTLRDLNHDRWRSLLTVLNLAVLVLSYLLLSALSQAFVRFGRQPQVSSNLVIISADVLDPMESSLDESVLEAVHQLAPQEIIATFPAIFRHMNVQGQVMQVRAVPLEQMRSALALTLVQGGWPEGQQQVVISEGATQISPWKIGSTIPIYGMDFQVAGIIKAPGSKFASIWMTYPEGQRLFGAQRGFQMGMLQLVASADPEKVRSELQASAFFADKYSIYLENSLSDRYNQINRDLLVLSLVQVLISLLAITFGTFNSVSLNLTERSREIVLLRIIGFSQKQLRVFLLAHTLVLSLLAYLLGWVAAYFFIAYQQVHAPISIQAAPLVLDLSPATTGLGILLTVAFACLGIWLTVGSISKMSLAGLGEAA
jgi:ABC-type antimicrobial peptide transport system permease subunit